MCMQPVVFRCAKSHVAILEIKLSPIVYVEDNKVIVAAKTFAVNDNKDDVYGNNTFHETVIMFI